MNSEFKVIIPPKYKEIKIMKGFFINRKDNAEAIINIDGTITNKNEYSYVGEMLPGEKFIVEINNKKGIIDKHGQFILKPIFDSISIPDNSDGSVVILKDSKQFGIFELNSNKKILPTYSNLEFNKDQMLIVEKENKIGIIDINNNVILPFIFKEIQMLESKLYKYKFENKEGLINFEKCLR